MFVEVEILVVLVISLLALRMHEVVDIHPVVVGVLLVVNLRLLDLYLRFLLGLLLLDLLLLNLLRSLLLELKQIFGSEVVLRYPHHLQLQCQGCQEIILSSLLES